MLDCKDSATLERAVAWAKIEAGIGTKGSAKKTSMK